MGESVAVWVLRVSDKYESEALIGVYSTRARAEAVSMQFAGVLGWRPEITEMVVDQTGKEWTKEQA